MRIGFIPLLLIVVVILIIATACTSPTRNGAQWGQINNGVADQLRR